jgi:hypothetical protein
MATLAILLVRKFNFSGNYGGTVCFVQPLPFASSLRDFSFPHRWFLLDRIIGPGGW